MLTCYTVIGIILIEKVITLYSVKQASAKLGISERRVRKLLEDRRIKGDKLGGHDWIVFSLKIKKIKKTKERAEQ